MGKEPTKEPRIDKLRKAVGLKGQSEASRSVYQTGPRKGQPRNVNKLFKQGSTQKTTNKKMVSGTPGESVKKLVDRVKGSKETTTRLKQRTKTGQLKSIKEGRKSQFSKKLTPKPTAILKATPASVIAGMFVDSSPTNNYNFEKAYDVAGKNGQATFKWDGRSYKSGVYDKVKTKIKELSQNEVPIIIEGAYLGKRKQTMTEGAKKVRKNEEPKRASKTGLPKNKGPKIK